MKLLLVDATKERQVEQLEREARAGLRFLYFLATKDFVQVDTGAHVCGEDEELSLKEAIETSLLEDSAIERTTGIIAATQSSAANAGLVKSMQAPRFDRRENLG